MRKFLINIVLSSIIFALSSYGFDDWQYWMLFVCVAGVMVNNEYK